MDHPELRNCPGGLGKRWVAWTKAAAEREGNDLTQCILEAEPADPADERDLGKGRDKRGWFLGAVNGEGAVINTLIAINHQLLGRGGSEERSVAGGGGERFASNLLRKYMKTASVIHSSPYTQAPAFLPSPF